MSDKKDELIALLHKKDCSLHASVFGYSIEWSALDDSTQEKLIWEVLKLSENIVPRAFLFYGLFESVYRDDPTKDSDLKAKVSFIKLTKDRDRLFFTKVARLLPAFIERSTKINLLMSENGGLLIVFLEQQDNSVVSCKIISEKFDDNFKVVFKKLLQDYPNLKHDLFFEGFSPIYLRVNEEIAGMKRLEELQSLRKRVSD